MKGKFILLALLLSTFWVGAQAQGPLCDLRLEPRGNNVCMTVNDDHVKACRGASVTYRAFSPGSLTAYYGFTWTVEGGTIVSQTSNFYSTECTVEWGYGDEGMVSVTANWYPTCYRYLQVDLVDLPTIGLVSAPNYVLEDPDNSNHKVIEVCDGETVVLTDNSTADGASISGYYWKSLFGTSNARTYRFETHGTGEFDVVHRVYNECGCYSEEVITIRVKEGCPLKLSCFGAVCAHTQGTYAVENPLHDKYYWTVENGTLMEPKDGRSVTVLWGAPESGFGTLTLASTKDECECVSRKSFQVPVISDRVPISGPDTICQGEQYEYSLPLWGATEYNWSSNSSLMAVTPLNGPHSNKVQVTASQSGIYNLEAVVENKFLHCGPIKIRKKVVVKPELLIKPIEEEVCKGSSVTLSAGDHNCRWTIMKNNQVVYTVVADDIDYTFTESGVYVIYAESDNYCNRVSTVVTVHDLPQPPENIGGPHVVCPNSSAHYYITNGNGPRHYTLWRWRNNGRYYEQGNDHIDVSFGNTFSGMTVYTVDRVTGCLSEPVNYPVAPLQLYPWPYNNSVNICWGEQMTLASLVDQSDDGVFYEWSVSPANALSVQGSNNGATVTLLARNKNGNEGPMTATVTLKRSYCGSSVTNQMTVHIGQIAAPQIIPGTLCEGWWNTFSTSAPADALEDSTYWYVDNNVNQKEYGETVDLMLVGDNGPNYMHLTSTHVVHLHYVTKGGCVADTQITVTTQYCEPAIEFDDGCTRPNNAFQVVQYCNNTIGIENSVYYPLPITISKNGRTIYQCTVQNAAQRILVPETGNCVVSARWENGGHCFRYTSAVNMTGPIPQFALINDCRGNLIIIGRQINSVTVNGVRESFETRYVNVSFPITRTGNYNVHLEFGLNCYLDTVFYFHKGAPTIDPIIVDDMCVNNSLLFSASVHGGYAPLSYSWNFGDGSTYNGNNISHVYSTTGNKTVTLTVTDAIGCTATRSTNFHINSYDGAHYTLTHSVPDCPDPNDPGAVLEVLPADATYTWHPNVYTSPNNTAYVTASGYYYVDVTTPNKCHRLLSTKLTYPNGTTRPTPTILARRTYCLGEYAELNGDMGRNFSYHWDVEFPDNSHKYSTQRNPRNIKLDQAGTYTVTLAVSNPDNNSCPPVTATTTIQVFSQEPAPTIILSNPACIGDGPVTASVSPSSNSYLWSNGVRGTSTQYYTGGQISVYRIAPATGCPSETATITIPEAPDFDGLLTGCYSLCKDQFDGRIPLYNLGGNFNYGWYWDGQKIYNGNLPPCPDLLPIPDQGDYQLRVNYGAGCTAESPIFSVRFDDAECHAVDFQDVYVKCDPQGCALFYHVYARVVNNTNDVVRINHVELSSSHVVSFTPAPIVIAPGSYRDVSGTIEYEEITPTGIQFYFIDENGDKAGILAVDLSEWTECFDDCGFDLRGDLNLVYNEYNQSAFFDFNLYQSDIIAVWSDEGEIYNPGYDGRTYNGLLVLDNGLTSQLTAENAEFCFHVLVCNGGNICMANFCIPYDEIWNVVQDGGFIQYANGNSNSSPESKPHTFILQPNPATDIVDVRDAENNASVDGIVSIEVISMQGKKVLSVEGMSQFDVSNLPTGAYIVRVVTDTDKYEYLKLIKK